MAGMVDVQVNGYMGFDFNSDDLSIDGLRQACEALRADGVDHILATIITDEVGLMAGRLSKIAKACDEDPLIGSLICGLHVEGPFINETPGFVGAHPIPAVRPASIDAMQTLLDAGAGLVRLVTLAPERDADMAVTRYLSEQNIIVSAGHCDSSIEELKRAIDAGLSMFTHLGNGCPGQMHRHDNIIQRVLSLTDQLWVSFVADGIHVPFFALHNYLERIGYSRAIVTTDAMLAAGLGPGTYPMGGKEVSVDERGVTRFVGGDDSFFVGCAATFPMMLDRLRSEIGLDEATLGKLVNDNPRRLLNL